MVDKVLQWEAVPGNEHGSEHSQGVVDGQVSYLRYTETNIESNSYTVDSYSYNILYNNLHWMDNNKDKNNNGSLESVLH